MVTSSSTQTGTNSSSELSYLDQLFASLGSNTWSADGSGQRTTQVQIWQA